MHTIWIREHNRIASRLEELNPFWDDQLIFQVSRQIVGAELQKITFKDYLPIVMGEGYSLISNYTNVGYQNGTDPSIPNAFATAAFRFWQSQVQPVFDRLDQNFQPADIGPLNLINSFFNPREFTNSNGTDTILRGLLTNPARKVDEFLTEVLTNHLFQTNASTTGMDLASLNIQRGRDHGIPPYLTWKRWAESECGVSSEVNNELTMIRLLQTYGGLETVDLWVGGLAENSLPGGIIGATFACIFAKTFEAIRNGDRFYYENNDNTTAIFTPGQREAIENTSLSRVICNNADDISRIQPNAFRADQNHVPCSSLPDIDLTQWSSQCYLKITVNRQMTDLTFDSLSVIVGQSAGMDYSSTIPRGERHTCLRFQCPGDGQNITLSVFSPSGSMPMCRTRRINARLPPNQSIRTGNYIGLITPDNINGKSGLYADIDSCINGNKYALKFWCGGDQTNKQVDIMEELESVLERTDSDRVTIQEWMSIKSSSQSPGKYIPVNSPILPQDIQQALQTDMKKHITLSAQNEVISNNKLISLFETVLKQLKEADTHQKEATSNKNKIQAFLDLQNYDGDDSVDTQVVYEKLIKALDNLDDTK